MFRPKTSVYLLAPMVLAVAALSACSSQYGSEENLLRQFFRASGLRDSQTLANFATVSFDAKTEGTVSDFDVTDVRSSAGLGLRIDTPIGPIRIEYGWKIDREPDETPGEFIFAIGAVF